MLQVLMLFSGEEPALSVEQIAARTDIPTQSVYRYIALLRETGLAEEYSYGHYSLSPRCLALGRAAESVYAGSAVVHERLDHLAKLSGETALLLRRLEDHAVCADIVETSQHVRLSFRVGHQMPLHRGAAPKVLLASLGHEWAERYFARCAPPVAATERPSKMAELARIREQRWAQSSAEVDEGIWAVAAPVYNGDRLIASVTVAGPRFRITPAIAESIRAEVMEVAEQLSA